MIILDITLIIFLFSLVAISHKILASNKIKIGIAEKLGEKIAFYRLFYNLSSIIFFSAFYSIAPRPDVIVYDLHFPYDIITFALQFISLIGLVWSAQSKDWKEFVGISQIVRYMQNDYNVDDLDEKQTFKIAGAQKFVRHPLYFFSILFLGLRPTMNLFDLILLICVAVYFYIGSIYEEQKLVERFGNEYAEYKQKVPRLFPIIFHSTIYD